MAINNLTKKKRIFSIWFHKEIGTEKESKQCGSHQFFSLLFFVKKVDIEKDDLLLLLC